MVFERQGDPTATARLKVLIVGKSRHGFFGLGQRLEQWGCQCSIVDSQESARGLLSQQGFELVLAVDRQCRLGSELVSALEGTGSSLFRAFPVEDSCWWLPVLEQGRECHDGRALRPTEFARLVREMVHEWKLSGDAALQRRLVGFAQFETVPKPQPVLTRAAVSASSGIR